MDSRELAELQRLMKKASDAGLMDGGKMQSTLTQGGGKTQSISSAGAVTGAMTDACKRRKNEPEMSADSEWDATVGRASDCPAIDNQARYVTEGDTVSAKPIKKEKGDVGSTVKTPVLPMCATLTRVFPFLQEWLISKNGAKQSL